MTLQIQLGTRDRSEKYNFYNKQNKETKIASKINYLYTQSTSIEKIVIEDILNPRFALNLCSISEFPC